MTRMEPVGGAEYVTPIPPRPPSGSSRLRWLGVLAGFAVLVGVVVLQRHTGNAPAAADTPTPASSVTDPASSTGTNSATATTTSPATSTVPTPGSTTTATYPITAPFTGYGGPPPDAPSTAASTSGLATTIATLTRPATTSRGWEILGVGDQGVIRIDPTNGRVVEVPWPNSGSGGTAFRSLIPGRSTLLVSGSGDGTGLLVPDTGPARTAPGLLNTSGVVLPGPDAAHLWVEVNPDRPDSDSGQTMGLVDWHGARTGPSLTLPPYLSGYNGNIQPDGAGYLMASGVGGVYDVRPDGTRLITHGVVLAAGPTGYLVYECGDTPTCVTALIDRSSGSRHSIPNLPVGNTIVGVSGGITADGAHAAYSAVTATPVDIRSTSFTITAMVVIVDLATGTTREVSVNPSTLGGAAPGFGFSPDGRQLAVIASGGDIGLVDVSTGMMRDLGVTSATRSFLYALTTRATS